MEHRESVRMRLFVIVCPYCCEVRTLVYPAQDAYWCLSEDCRTSEKRNGVKALIWERGNHKENGHWILVEVDK